MGHQTKSRLVKPAPHQVLMESTHAKLTTPATVPNSLTVPKEPSHARRTHQRKPPLSLKEPLRLVKNAFHQLLMAQTHAKKDTPALVTSSKVALKEANPAKLTHSHQTKSRLVKPAPHQVLMESTHAKLTTLATVPNSLTVPKEPLLQEEPTKENCRMNDLTDLSLRKQMTVETYINKLILF